jgi:hypothetical protein
MLLLMRMSDMQLWIRAGDVEGRLKEGVVADSADQIRCIL